MAVENAAKELFGNDLLFNDDLNGAEEFWNELITSSENTTLLDQLHDQYRTMEEEDHVTTLELESSIKLEGSMKLETHSPTSNFSMKLEAHSPTSNFFNSPPRQQQPNTSLTF